MNWEIVGFAAGILTTFGFVPQIIKGYKTKHLGDLSYLMNASLTLGMSLWLSYGISKKDIVIIAANIAGIALNITLILMKYHYGKTTGKAEKNH
ncbi:SemiSWEET transporter [Candidatus Woesearchaeota archaeon]|nr:SemiSWEET transporter [Candidatus Woesearchaeota archaeon]